MGVNLRKIHAQNVDRTGRKDDKKVALIYLLSSEHFLTRPNYVSRCKTKRVIKTFDIFLDLYFAGAPGCDLFRFRGGYFRALLGSGIVHRGFVAAVKDINRYAIQCKVKVGL